MFVKLLLISYSITFIWASLGYSGGLAGYVEQIAIKNELPQDMPPRFNHVEEKADILVHAFGSIPCMAKIWMDPLVQLLKKTNVTSILEVMAGSGWMSYFLDKHYGMSVDATDNGSKDYSKVGCLPAGYEVNKADAVAAIDQHPEADCLIMSWPNIADIEKSKRDVPLESVNQWNGKGLIVCIGEPKNGRCFSDECLDKLFTRYDKINIPEYYNPHGERSYDRLNVYCPNENNEPRIDPDRIPDSFYAKRQLLDLGLSEEDINSACKPENAQSFLDGLDKENANNRKIVETMMVYAQCVWSEAGGPSNNKGSASSSDSEDSTHYDGEDSDCEDRYDPG